MRKLGISIPEPLVPSEPPTTEAQPTPQQETVQTSASETETGARQRISVPKTSSWCREGIKTGDEKKEGDTTVEGGLEGGDSGTLQPGTGTEEDETKSGDVEQGKTTEDSQEKGEEKKEEWKKEEGKKEERKKDKGNGEEEERIEEKREEERIEEKGGEEGKEERGKGKKERREKEKKRKEREKKKRRREKREKKRQKKERRISLNQQRAKKLKGKEKNEQRSQQEWKSPPQKVMSNHHEHLDSFLPAIYNCMIISLLFYKEKNILAVGYGSFNMLRKDMTVFSLSLWMH